MEQTEFGVDALGTMTAEEVGPQYRNTYVRVSYGKLTEPTGSPEADGRALAEECLTPLRGAELFPPQLFILWVTPPFCGQIEPLLDGIYAVLTEHRHENVDLIGSSVAVCMFDPAPHGQRGQLRCYDSGAVLICLASRFLKARAAVAPDAGADPAQAVKNLLRDLYVGPDWDIRPPYSRFLVAFLPDYADENPAAHGAAEIVAALCSELKGMLPVFGGISSRGDEQGPRLQILGRAVHTGAVVAAEVSSPLTVGLGMSQGLTPTGTCYRVRDVAADGRTLRLFWGEVPDPLEVWEREQGAEPWVFAQEGPAGDRVVFVPKRADRSLQVQRRVRADTTLYVMRPDGQKLRQRLDGLKNWIVRNYRIPAERLVAGLGINCFSRYRAHDPRTFDPGEALPSLRDRYPRAGYVGCFMDGEVGIDSLGQTVFANWSVSELLLADDLPVISCLYLLYEAFQKCAGRAHTAGSIQETMKWILRCVETAGYHGGLLSLVLENSGRKWVVGQEALGDHWKNEIRPDARYPLDDEHIVARVARAKPKDGEVIHDAWKQRGRPEPGAPYREVRSFSAFPLLDERDNVLGVLQIDLGDAHDLPALSWGKRVALRALSEMAATALSAAMKTEELRVSGALDRALEDCRQHCRTPEDAADRFAKAAAAALRASAHVRFAVPGKNTLELVGGAGPYYDAAREDPRRHEIDLGIDSPATVAFRESEPRIINDAHRDPLFLSLNRALEGTAAGPAHASIGSCALIPVRHPEKDEPIGVFAFHATVPWFFTPPLERSLTRVAEHLMLLLAHIRQKQQREANLRFLEDLRPSLETEDNVYAALRNRADQARRAARADVISYYLWDDGRHRLVLRAESGGARWRRWVDAAWFDFEQELTAELSLNPQPRHFPDIRACPGPTNVLACKYLDEMLDEPLREGETCEMIALHLQAKGRLCGIVTLHRRRPVSQEHSESGFATVDPGVLREASQALAGAILGLEKADRNRWEREEMTRLDAVSTALLRQEEHASRKALLDAFCYEVIQRYELRECAVYLVDFVSGGLEWVAGWGRRGPSAPRAPDEPLGNALAWEATVPIRRVNTRGQEDPVAVELEELVRRVCIPMTNGERVIGVVDLRWFGQRPVPDCHALPRHDQAFLERLVKRLSLALQINQMRRDAEDKTLQASTALTGAGAILIRNLHDIGGILNIKRLLNSLRHVALNPTHESVLRQLLEKVSKLETIYQEARDEADRIRQPKWENCRLDVLLRRILEEHRGQADAAGITLEPDLREVSAVVVQELMLKCFEILIQNAVREMKDSPSGRPRRLSVSLRTAADNKAVIVLADTGPGLSPEVYQHILAGTLPASKAKGSGAGLQIAGLYCAANRARLTPGPPSEAGATFEIRIPLP